VKWETSIIDNMDTADLILLMMSDDYYDSSYTFWQYQSMHCQ